MPRRVLESHPKFIQIAVACDEEHDDRLYALDEEGGVWFLAEDLDVKEWKKVDDDEA